MTLIAKAAVISVIPFPFPSLPFFSPPLSPHLDVSPAALMQLQAAFLIIFRLKRWQKLAASSTSVGKWRQNVGKRENGFPSRAWRT